MPNYCNYNMKVTGRKPDVNRFLSILKYEDKEYALSRIFEADKYKSTRYKNTEFVSSYITGYCAWSCSSTMLDGLGSYYATYGNFQNDGAPRRSHLKELTKLLDIVVELYSDESGMCFQEHILVSRGDIIIDDCVDWTDSYEDEDGNYIEATGGYGEISFEKHLKYLREEN